MIAFDTKIVGTVQKVNGVNEANWFIANRPSDRMTLGVVEAEKAAGKQDQVEVYDTDGSRRPAPPSAWAI